MMLGQKQVTQTDIHIYLEACMVPWVDDAKPIKDWAWEIVKLNGFTPVSLCSHETPDAGLTIAIILLESHVVIHTWPERNKTVIIDISICNYSGDNSQKAQNLADELIKLFQPDRQWTYTIKS